MVEKITALDTAKKIISGDVSVIDIIDETIKNIKGIGRNVNAFITITDDIAYRTAEIIDNEIKDGIVRSPLVGVPIAVKDNICTKGIKTTVASKILSDYIPPYDATVIELIKSAGLIIVGKTNLDEFAMGSSNETSIFGPVHNPYRRGYSPGGSSGGSCASVSSGMVPVALASDCGGSIRQPSAFCGVYGLKPTYGLVSRYGLISFIPSTDQIGPVANNVSDIASLLTIISSYDEHDANSIKRENIDYLNRLNDGIDIKKVGLITEWVKSSSNDVGSSVEKVCEKIANLGIDIVDVNLPYTKYAVATYRLLADAEASSNMARYDGMNFTRRGDGKTILDVYMSSRGDGLGDEVKRRILIGTFILSRGYQERFYWKAMSARIHIRNDFLRALSDVDLLLGPTTPSPPFKIGEIIDDPLAMYLSDVFVVPANLAGLPAMNIPAGFTKDGLPLGVQLIGGYLEEEKILALASML
ncbi:MAG: Asp-tRNA(Asn)/Glu-tRNA(Gln) amidotransferase subunit GatA [bacterium]